MGSLRLNLITMKYLLVIAFLSVTSASTHSTFKLSRSEQCEDGSKCLGGCCPYVDWYCCPDGFYCAATAADCPFVAKKQALAKVGTSKQCENECPGGCCPIADWYCCMDGGYCAEYAVDCRFIAKKETLTKMSANKQCHDGIECPGGCCPYDDWYYCPDGLYCAASAADCPFYA